MAVVVVVVVVVVAVVAVVAVARLPVVAVAVARVADCRHRPLPQGLVSRRGTRREHSEMRKS